MRKQFVKTVESLMSIDPSIFLILGDIGVFGFRNVLENHSRRAINIGILEQSSVGVGAGISKEGMIPIIHTIAPFLIERAYEQIKVDLGYQKLGCNLVSVGASFDYASLGCTHHCPGDVGILQFIPNIEIVVPGNASEFDMLFRASYSNGNPTYFRLTEESNTANLDISFGKGNLIKKGRDGVIVAVGPMLDRVLTACINLDVTILYYTTLIPFDFEILLNSINDKEKIIFVEPYYEGTTHIICSGNLIKHNSIMSIGVPRRFLNNYGTSEEHNDKIGLTSLKIEQRIKRFLYE